MDEAKERARKVWSTGDYAPFGRQLEGASVALVESSRIGAGDSVLDVAAGDGNLALEAARRGAVVTATDFSDPMTRATHGVWVVLKANMPPDRYASLSDAVDEVLREHNTAKNGAVQYDSAYLEALIRKPA